MRKTFEWFLIILGAYALLGGFISCVSLIFKVTDYGLLHAILGLPIFIICGGLLEELK